MVLQITLQLLWDLFSEVYMSISVGTILNNRYKILELAGTGGMAKVYNCLLYTSDAADDCCRV